VYVVEPGEGGQGIQIRKGDRFTIPAGWLKISLDPSKSTGRLSRSGVTWLVTNLTTGELPTAASDVEDYLERLKSRCDEVLEGSDKLSHLDPDDERDGDKAFELLKSDRDSIEWWAFVMGSYAAALLNDLRTGGPAGEMLLHSFRMQAAHSMMVFKQSLEEHVWTGYRHTSIIYEIAAAGAHTPEEAEKIQALRPLFSGLDEDVLHAWVESDIKIGPRINVTNVDEVVLRGLAKYHLSLFERRRREAEFERDRTVKVWANRIAAAVAGATVASVILTAVL
jgi:hypothetical protein